MLYWDASALVSLCVKEADTDQLRRLVSKGIVTWAVSRVEIASAIERRRREERLDQQSRLRAIAALDQLAGAWTEIHAVDAVCERAVRLLAAHPLRSADAMQLAAALVCFSDRPRGHGFVCRDLRLSEAASREGFQIDF